MGYYSKFRISSSNKTIDLEKFKERLEYVTQYSFYVGNKEDTLFSIDDIKWYDYDLDMKAISKDYPNDILMVIRSGEDFWNDFQIHKYQDGKEIFNEKYSIGKILEKL